MKYQIKPKIKPVIKGSLNFGLVQYQSDSEMLSYISILLETLKGMGHRVSPLESKLNFVINLINIEKPKIYRRKRQEEFVISFGLIQPTSTQNIKSICYHALVKSLSNLFFGFEKRQFGDVLVYCITPEVGFVQFPFDPMRIIRYMEPVIHAHLVLDNIFICELPSSTSISIPEVQQLIRFGKILDGLGLLPAPFPLSKIISKELARSIYKLYRIKGLSYGNLSIRANSNPTGGTKFWMTARGVNKGQLKGIGKDILLVSGYDEINNNMIVSIPTDQDLTSRVSVDAIEHYLIYENFPEVGAIVHVHAWISGIKSTEQHHPCGSRELAEAVVEILSELPDPGKAVIGLKNHGLTITGNNLEEIFDRIGNKLNTNVPMFE